MAAKAQVVDIKHVVMTVGNGLGGSDAEAMVRETLKSYFDSGWDLFAVHLIREIKDVGISNEYILVKYA